jgi:hypothetical protein
MKYITHADFCRAKNLAGNMHIDKVIPVKNRKLFPFKYFTNFHTRVLRQNGNVVKPLPPLMCAHCDEDLSEWGNGSYYTAYIVFDSAHEFYACCKECIPRGTMEYYDQTFGHRHPMKIMQNGKVFDWVEEKHFAVFYRFMSGSKSYMLWNYPDGFKSVGEAKKAGLGQSHGGGTIWGNAMVEINGEGWDSYEGLRYNRQDKDFKTIWKLNENQTLAIINEIIRHNVSANFMPVVTPGVQLTLF